MSGPAPSPSSDSRRLPGLWSTLGWALKPGRAGGGLSRSQLARRVVTGNLLHARALHRWMAIVYEFSQRGLVKDVQGEYLRAVRPSVHRYTDMGERVKQLIDHADWVDTAFKPAAMEKLASGQPVVLAELPAPRGFDAVRLQLRRNSMQSPEGDLLLALTLQRASDIQHKAQPVDAAVVAFSRFRVDGTGSLVIGGVRGQRSATQRLSGVELGQALAGWQPSVLLVRVMQELARAWDQQLLGLHPQAHWLLGWPYRMNKRHRENAERIAASYDKLWEHFDADPGPTGWVVLPSHSDEAISATALSPEKRERQSRRADYWIRLQKQLRKQMPEVLQRPGRETQLTRNTQQVTEQAPMLDDWKDFPEEDERAAFNKRVMQTGPLNLFDIK
ncbi:MAG: DUF535 family protein [Burkholderiales bacterium]|nr:DUF535 family protein [Burkholderiales bacterium]